MKKIYFASKIANHPDPEDTIFIDRNTKAEDIYKQYIEKTLLKDSFIKNGHWIIKSPGDTVVLPKDLSSEMIWEMVKYKIHTSDIFIGVINTNSFGTIAEAGYASSLGKPTYLLFDQNLTQEEKEDLWFILQFSKNTQNTWSEEDIQAITLFGDRKIYNLKDYKFYIENIIPSFLK